MRCKYSFSSVIGFKCIGLYFFEVYQKGRCIGHNWSQFGLLPSIHSLFFCKTKTKTKNLDWKQTSFLHSESIYSTEVEAICSSKGSLWNQMLYSCTKTVSGIDTWCKPSQRQKDLGLLLGSFLKLVGKETYSSLCQTGPKKAAAPDDIETIGEQKL